jgi:hypothetical protein
MFGDLSVLLIVRVSRLNWIGHVSRMDSKGKVSKVFNNNPVGSRRRVRPKTDGAPEYKQIFINTKLKTINGGQKTELIRRSIGLWCHLRRRRRRRTGCP